MTRIYNIQFLRFIAATLVAAIHLEPQYSAQGGSEWFATWCRYGFSGVDMFFVISGYIMYATTKDSTNPVDFGWKRVTRIFSTYWPVLVIFCLVSSYYGVDRFTDKNLWGSIFLFETAHKECVLWVSWTLSFELYFYLFFTVALFVGRKHIIPMTFLFSILNLCLMELSRVGLFQADNLFTSPMIQEFCFGVFVGLAAEKTISKKASLVFLLLGILVFVSGGIVSEFSEKVANRVTFFGMGSALIVFGAVQLDHQKISVGNTIFAWLGDASYSIYLLHPIIYMLVGRLKITRYFAEREHLAGMPYFLTVIAIVLICSLLFYWCFEKPFYNLFRRNAPSTWGKAAKVEPVLEANAESSGD